MKLVVDTIARKAKMRAHTATHLLHYLLDHLLWGTKQAGSFVEEDYLRFDFAAKQPLTIQQLQEIETAVNDRIGADAPVTIEEMSMAEAKKKWAKAFFEDKYGEVVRVVQIPAAETNPFPGSSTELCGGTHVAGTGVIGAFKITNQEAVASGIRRIEALTWPKVSAYAQEQENELLRLAQLLDCQPKQLQEKLQKLLQEYTSLNDNSTSLQEQIITQTLKGLHPWQSHAYRQAGGDLSHLINLTHAGIDQLPIKTIVQSAKQLRPEENRLLGTDEGQFALFAGKTKNAKELQTALGLKGGGDNELIQGKDPELWKKLETRLKK